jgi:hypothetical protein
MPNLPWMAVNRSLDLPVVVSGSSAVKRCIFLVFNLSSLTTQNYPESNPKSMDKGGKGMDN